MGTKKERHNVYPPEYCMEVLQRIKAGEFSGLTDASKKLGIPVTTLRNWTTGTGLTGKGRLTKKRFDNYQLLNLLKELCIDALEYSLKGQDEAIRTKALERFNSRIQEKFEKYI